MTTPNSTNPPTMTTKRDSVSDTLYEVWRNEKLIGTGYVALDKLNTPVIMAVECPDPDVNVEGKELACYTNCDWYTWEVDTSEFKKVIVKRAEQCRKD